MQKSRFILVTISTLLIVFIGLVIYQLTSSHTDKISGTSDFPALNLLSSEVDTTSKSLIKANLRLQTSGKFNPTTAYVHATGYKKTSGSDGGTNLQFYITIPEVKSTYQITLSTSLVSSPDITLTCAPQSLQPSANTCYTPPSNSLVYVRSKDIYA